MALAATAMLVACDGDGAGATDGAAGSISGPGASAPSRLVLPWLDNVADRPLVDAVNAACDRLEREPSSREAWLSWSMLLAAHDWRAEAAAGFARLEELEPEEFRWPYLQAVLLAASDREAALAAVERAVARDDRYAPAHVTHGRLLMDGGDDDAAKAAFERAVALDARLLDGWLALGQLALQQRDAAAAETTLRRALAIDSQHPEVNGALAAACFSLGRQAEADAYARTARLQARAVFSTDPRAAIDSPPITAKDHVDAAIARMQQGRAGEAQALLERALSIDPAHAVAWINLAHIQMGRRDNVAAERSLRESLRHTASASAAALLARLLRGRGALEEAISFQRQAVAQDEDEVDYRRELALQLQEAKRNGEAAAEWEQVVAARPAAGAPRRDGVRALKSMAAAARSNGEGGAVASALRRALALQSGVELARELAWLLATAEDPEVRAPEAAAALVLPHGEGRDSDAPWLEMLAAVRAANGDFGSAVAAVERAQELYRFAGNRAAVARCDARLAEYRAGRPLRVPLTVVE
jgi:tetratricopeptide (TPR) repeat protein